jgi:sugar/nucleoside kinase (ribokinase family)
MLGGATYEDAARLAAKVSAFVVSRTEAVPEYSLINDEIKA